MDSLTQITLGAAVGEIVLGRKIGNRALFWGAVGGTIPDLDVFAAFFVSPCKISLTMKTKRLWREFSEINLDVGAILTISFGGPAGLGGVNPANSFFKKPNMAVARVPK